MRSLVVLAAAYLGSGCSVLDQIDLNSPPTLDPTRIYLGSARVMVGARDTQRYACVNGPLMCDGFGASFDCSCPSGQ